MIRIEIRNYRLVVLVIFVLCKKSFQNKPEYEFAPTLSFEPVTFVQHEEKQSNNGFWNVNAPNDDEIKTEDIVPGLSPADGRRRVIRQATYPGQLGHAQVPLPNGQNGFNTNHLRDQQAISSFSPYGSVTPNPQYPYYNNFQSGQSPYYPSNQPPGFSQYPSNSQPGQVPQYPNNVGSSYYQSPNPARPGYTQPSAPSAPSAPSSVTPGYSQYLHNNQPGQLAQYPTNQRPGYQQYPSKSQFGQTQPNSSYVNPGYNHYQHNNQPGQLPQYPNNQRPGYPGNQYPSNSQFGQTLPNPGNVNPGYHQVPSFNQSGHASQHPTNLSPGYNQYPSNSQSQYPSNQNPTYHQNPNNYQSGHSYRYKRHSSPTRPGNSQAQLSLTQPPGNPNNVPIPGYIRPG